ncbi:glycosyl transferase [Pilimelia anulata]|uniref:4,4'-diaponeurosporenoate glycosyltransferase n=1 Tax=Pilimelia anulata TaxID=53371 RepID=A0A8J3BGU6_9ACTN|nr:glycosyltransferase [Pilimelia anulata]GGK02643.1 glycosyl transferase [Pilimelia anulata]
MRLWVVVPAHNEAATIGATLAALAAQWVPPAGIVVVDNASTDGTAAAVRGSGVAAHLVAEAERGAGRAADTGCRYAIARGATHLARTDADCLPDRDWTMAIAAGFAAGYGFLAGRLYPRTDDGPVPLSQRALLGPVQSAFHHLGRLRPDNRGRAYRGPYVLAAGANLAITAELYERSGGFPRADFSAGFEDRALANRVRAVTDRYARRPDMRVRWSMRRVREQGWPATIAWYTARRPTGPADVREPARAGADRP